MPYIYLNLNPMLRDVGDCAIRSIALATDSSWDYIFSKLVELAFVKKDVLISNDIWQTYLESINFIRYRIPNTCPLCYSVKDFCIDHPFGIFILGTGSHVVTVIDGNYYDTWDSGNEIPVYFWQRGE